jgi:hypothetical protein
VDEKPARYSRSVGRLFLVSFGTLLSRALPIWALFHLQAEELRLAEPSTTIAVHTRVDAKRATCECPRQDHSSAGFGRLRYREGWTGRIVLLQAGVTLLFIGLGVCEHHQQANTWISGKDALTKLVKGPRYECTPDD